ncbi:MAG: sodium/solute symporter [Opitutaceae bacterium]
MTSSNLANENRHRCRSLSYSKRAWLLLIAVLAPTTAFAAEKGEAPLRGLVTADWLVLVGVALSLIAIGAYYTRRQKTAEEYFLADRNMSPFLVGISLYATICSTLTYLGLPGEVVQNGPVYLGATLVAFPAVYLAVAYLVIPSIMRLRVTSAYELLEARLGLPVRLATSGAFLMTRFVWMGLMLYTTSLILVTVMGWDPAWIPLISIITGVITTTYSLFGGYSAVVITDVLQFFILLVGAIATVVCITVLMGGVGPWWPTHWASHWSPQPFFSADPHVRVTMVGTFVGAIIWWVCTSASDQMAVQRYLSTRDVAAARRALLHNCIAASAVVVVLCLVGFAVLGFYQANPHFIPANLSFAKNGDAFFPHFVGHFLPAGLPGLVVAGLLAAAMSSLSSGINSSATVLTKDFVETLSPNPERTESTRVKHARLLAMGVGVAAIATSLLASLIPGNLVELGGKMVNLFLCPLFGIFFLALWVPFATPFGAIMGAFYSFVTALLVGYWDMFTGAPAISFQWIAPASLLVSITAGCIFSRLPTRGKPARSLAIYTVVALLPWVGVAAVLFSRHS